MSHTVTLQQLESFLWEAADILRGNMDASEYKDYILKDHTLMQAIARVNRTCASPNGQGAKEAGFIVDYYGLSDQLTEALEMFSNDDAEGTYHSLKDEIPKLKAAHTRVAKLFAGVKEKDIDTYVLFLFGDN